MEETEETRNSIQRLKSCSSGATASMPPSSSIPISRPPPSSLDLQNLRGPFRNLPPSPDSSKRFGGIPPTHPHFPSPPTYLQIPPTSRSPAVNFPQFHSRSLSQPAFFSLDNLPPFNSPSPPPSATSISDPSSADVAMEDRGPAAVNSQSPFSVPRTNDGLPPRKSHRRSQSDIPFDFRAISGLPPLPNQSQNFPNYLVSPREKLSNQNVKQETEGDTVGDDLFNAYMNLDSLDTLNSSGTEEKREDLDSRASGTKTNNGDSSENEAESSINENGKREGNKRAGAGDPASRHVRSLSMDSFMEKMNFGEESPKLPISTGLRAGLHSHSGSMDGTTSTFSLEFGNGEFSGAEMKKIMANEKLAEIAMADPKRAKRILANRQSAARSKERKMRYISELEHKVQTLQTEATTLSAQLTLLQRDSSGLTNQNNELKFRLQAMEQQAHLRDALNEALTSEVQRLKLVSGESQLANSLNQQMQLNPRMFQMQQVQKQQQQSSQMSHFQMQTQHQSQQQQQQQKNNDASKHDANK